MSNPNLVRKPAVSANTTGEVSSLDVSSISSQSKNLIVNGGLDFWQRGTSFSSSGTQTMYTADRWKLSSSGSVARTISRSTSVPTSSSSLYSFQYAVTTGAALSAAQWEDITYTIEGNDLRKFKGQTFTISFWVKANFAGTMTTAIRNYANNRSYVTTYTINTANTWEQKTITLTHDTTGTWNYDNQGGMVLYFPMGTGSNYQTNSLNQWINGNFGGTSTMFPVNATTGNTVNIADVMLNVGSIAAPFSLYGSTFDGELAACQRYYEVMTASLSGYNETGNNYVLSLPFKVEKRGTPTPAKITTGTSIIGSGFTVDATTTNTSCLGFFSTGTGERRELNLVASGDAEL